MSDIADEAAALQEHALKVALANRQRQEQKFTGRCHWCDSAISSGNYCDSDCRDDHQLYMRAQIQRAV